MARIKGKWEWYNVITDEPCSLIGRGFSFTSNNEPFIGLRIFVGAGGGVDVAYLYDDDEQGVYYMGDSEVVNSNYRTIDFGSTQQEIDDGLYDFIVRHAISRDPKTVRGKWRWNESIPATDSADLMRGCAVSFTSNDKSYDLLSIDTVDIGAGVGSTWALFYGSDTVCVGEAGSESIPISPEYREMDFGSAEQEVSHELYLYLLANATYLMPEIAEKLGRIAENEQRVYDAGYRTGYEQGEAAGVEQGKRSEYDLFWDTFQKNGDRRYYERAFADTTNGGRMWINGKNYRPKYPMKPLQAMQMYEYGYLPYEAIAAVDFSECTDFYGTFAYFSIVGTDKKFPPIDISSATRTQNMFGWCTGIKEIEEICVSETTPYSSCFAGTTNLVEVKFNGTIAQNGLNFKDCTQLSVQSIESVINHLSGTTTGLKVTFSRTAVNKAFETSEGANDGETSAEWAGLIATKSNWTIALA